MSAPLPSNETARLDALRQYQVLDTPPEAEFDDLTYLAAQICGTPISTLTLIDQDRQWFKSRVGLKMSEAPREISICAHAILEPDMLLVPDLQADPRFADNPLVTGEPHLRFYAGVPVVTPEGQSVGTLCVIDTKPRQLDPKQREALHRLAHQAVALLEARPDTATYTATHTATEKRQSRQERRQSDQESRTQAAETISRGRDSLTDSELRYRRLFESAQDGILILDAVSGQIEDVNPYLCQLLGYAPEDFLGKQLWEIGTFRDIAANKDAFRALQQKEYIRHDDLPLQTRDGKSVSVEFVSNVYQSGDKKVIQCNIRNITARKQSQAQLNFQKTLLEAQMETSLDGILVVSENGKILSYNQHFLQMWKVPTDISSDEGDNDTPLRQFVSEQLVAPQEFSARVRYLYEHHDEQSHEELALLDGRIFDRYSAPVATDSFYYGRVWYFRDITGRKQAESSLQRAHDELESRVTERTTELRSVNQQLHVELAERALAEAALREAEQMLQLVMNHIPQAIFWKDRQSVYLGANYRLAADAGFASPEELKGKNDFEMPWAEYASAYQADDGQVMEADAAKLNIEEPLVRADGGFVWLRTNKIPLHDSENQVVGILCSYEDITEQKQAEALINEARRAKDAAHEELRAENLERQKAEVEVQRSQDELQSFIDAMSTLAAKVAPDGTLLMVNQIAIDASGLTREELLNANFLTGLWWAFDSEIQARVQEGFSQALCGVSVNYDEQIFLFGQVRTINFSLIPLRDAEGHVEYIIAEGRDITERKQAEVLLMENRQRLALATESAHIGIWDWNVVANRIVWDEQMYQLYGIGEKEFTGAYDVWQKRLHPEDRAQAEADLVMALDGIQDFHTQFRVVWPNDEIRHIEAHAMVQRNDDGNALRMIGVNWDNTELKQFEKALRLAKEEADSANLAKSEFLSRMSHELRTPLNAILGFGQIMEQQDLTPRQKESIGYILKGGRHLLDLINEVLDIARVEAGRVDLSLEPIALAEIVPEACALIRPLSAGRGIRLHENTAELGGIYILADQQRLKQVLINLLSNAIKYNREGGEVDVFCQVEVDGWIAIAVRDTGPGIAPQDLQKLFIPFERLNAGTSEIEGTGLGLALSQRLITAMGGTVTVTSILGEGTTFTLRFPQAASPEEQVTNVPPDVPHSSENRVATGTYSVLCIEDNSSNLRLIETLLEDRPEITLMAAMQGSVGLDLARQHEPDLILLDLNLPDMHGLQVLTRLQQSALTRDIPVVVISADATSNQIERLLSAGAKAYLTKPLDVSQFLDTLDEWLKPKKDA